MTSCLVQQRVTDLLNKPVRSKTLTMKVPSEEEGEGMS